MLKNTILWADDDMDDLQLIKEILSRKKRDFSIAEVHNGKEALHYLEKASMNNTLPRLIILDINMPVLDGKQTLSRIKDNEIFSTIPLVVFTTSRSELDKLFCTKFGVQMFTKPASVQKLEKVLDQLLSIALI